MTNPLFLIFLLLLLITQRWFCSTSGGIKTYGKENLMKLYCRKKDEQCFLRKKQIKKRNFRTILFVNTIPFHLVKKKEFSYSRNCSSFSNNYSADDIIILEGLEAVRKRPGMYIGNTDVKGLHQLLFEIIDNSVDEYINYECNKIKIVIHKDESVTIEDNGRGIPCDIHHKTQKSALETVLTVLHSGAKFLTNETDNEENTTKEVEKEKEKIRVLEDEINKNAEEKKTNRKKTETDKKQTKYSAKYKYSSGLHGVGLSVANALSTFMKVKVFRNKKMYSIELEKGKVIKEFTEQDCPIEKRGTQIHYKPDPSIFKSGIQHNHDFIKNRLHQLAYLNDQLTFLFCDERKESYSMTDTGMEEYPNTENNLKEKNEYNHMDFYNYEIIKHEGGLNEYIEHLTKNKSNLFKDNKIISISCFQKNIHIDLKMKWLSNQYSETIISFVNNVNTIDGGSHVDALKTAIAKCINVNMKKKENKNFINVSGEYIREGLIAILSIKINNPEFEGQTKNKLGSNFLKPVLENILFEKLSEFFDFEPNLLNIIYAKALQAKSSDEEAKAARDLIRSKNNHSYSTILPGKLVDCISDDVEKNEIFIVEGDSAAGSAKQARDREIQAILPLKGKILNIEKIKNNKRIFENSELKSLITAIGLSINYDVSKSGKSNNISFRNNQKKKGNKGKTDLKSDFNESTEAEINNHNSTDPKKKKETTNILMDKKLRYGKIIIMTDADVDGEHIRILLLTFLYRFQKDIIEKGNVYVACPPLYKITYDRFHDPEIKQLVMKQFNVSMKHTKCIIHTYSDSELRRLLQLLDKDEYTHQEKIAKKKGVEKVEDNIQNNKKNGHEIQDTNSVPDYESGYITDILKKTEKNESKKNGENKETDELKDPATIEKSSFIDDKTLFKVSQKYEIQRFKGLGEMMADELWHTTMKPDVRKLIRVTVNDAIKADELIFSLMGDDSKLRKGFILENTNLALL